MRQILLAALALCPFLASSLSAQSEGTVLFTEKFARGDQGDQFGRSIDLLGDLDDDGIPDLVVGASHSDDGETDAGSIWILFMRANRTVRSSKKISNNSGGLGYSLGNNDQFGKSVAALGDIDGDGVEDVAVGAPRDEDVYILLLTTAGTVKDAHKISHNSGDFGYSLAPVNDYDGNGTNDLVIGDGLGDIFLYYLDNQGQDIGWIRLNGESYGGSGGYDDFLGVGAAPIGDWNNDGLIDVALGDTAFDGGFTDSGAVHLISYDVFGNAVDETLLFDGISGLDLDLPDYPNFGRDITLIDDLDGNGVPEVVVGCSECHEGNEPDHAGALYVIFLAPDGSVLRYVRIGRLSGFLKEPLQAGDEFGISLANIGDWNGDGVSNLAVGARFDKNGTGKVYLLMMNDGNGVPVEASFRALPIAGSAPLDVQFTDTSDGDVTSWDWDFGDGNTSTAVNPNHIYTVNGTYSVTLTVGSVGGRSHSLTVADLVVVQDQGPDFQRLGCGTNPVGSLSIQSGLPVIGTTIVFGVDNPYGTQPVGSPVVMLYSFAPDANYPCGRLLPGFGQAGGGAAGELLVDISSQNLIRMVVSGSYGGPGLPGLNSVNIPNNANLIGATIFAQGFVLDTSGVSGIVRGLADGVEFTLR